MSDDDTNTVDVKITKDGKITRKSITVDGSKASGITVDEGTFVTFEIPNKSANSSNFSATKKDLQPTDHFQFQIAQGSWIVKVGTQARQLTGASTGSGTITIESDGSLSCTTTTANVFQVDNDNAQAQSVSIDTTVSGRGNAELGVQASSEECHTITLHFSTPSSDPTFVITAKKPPDLR